MKKRTKIITAMVSTCLVVGAWFAAYINIDSLSWIVSQWYSSSYTLEELNEKILKAQNKAVAKIEATLNESITSEDSQRINGKISLDLQAQSSFWGGSGSISLDNIDVQYGASNTDILVEWVNFSWNWQVFGEKTQLNLSLTEWHLISNSSGSYIKIAGLEVDMSDFWEIIPEEVIMTLNKLWEADKYINLTENVFYDIFKKQITSQSDTVSDMQKFMIDFAKNENILVATRQEDTKYFLAPSLWICTLKKNENINNQWYAAEELDIVADWPVVKNTLWNYEDFKNNFATCTQEEYEEFVNQFMSSEIHEIANLYIELNTTKMHYVLDTTFKSLESVESPVRIMTWIEGTVSMSESESSKVYMQIQHDSVTGSGLLIEQNGKDIQGYVDIDLPKYNFDSNVTLTGSTDNLEIVGNYSLIAPEEIEERDLQILESVEFSGNIDANIQKEDYSMQITHNFLQKEHAMSWKAVIEIDGKSLWDTDSWEMKISWELKLWENASPISWDITADWNTQTNESLAKWDISYELNIPNIASWKYNINYDFSFSDTLTSNFETPADIIPQKNLDSMIQINKNKIEKQQAEKIKDIIIRLKAGEQIDINKELWIGNWPMAQYRVDAMNSKTLSDIRTIATMIEVDITSTWRAFDSYVNSWEPIQTNDWILYTGSINFDTLWLESKDFVSSYWIPYEIRVFSIKKDEQTYAFYQLNWYTIRNNTLQENYKWSYYQMTDDMPESLFNIEIN